MKKILFIALLVAGTTLGFAKDNVQKNEETTTTKEAKQTVKTPQTDSNEEALGKQGCTDVHAYYEMVDGDPVYVGTMQYSYDCDSPQTNVYVWVD